MSFSGGIRMGRSIEVRSVSWPVRGRFAIARGSRTVVEAVHVILRDGEATGRAEAIPYRLYGETVDSVIAQVSTVAKEVEDGIGRHELESLLPPGAARNATDLALWDLEAKLTGVPVWRRLGSVPPRPVTTAYTISLDAPDVMAAAARAEAHRPLLKIKLSGDGDLERVAAVKAGAPGCRLVVDANEAWSFDQLVDFAPRLAGWGVCLIEQPLPANADSDLARFSSPVPLCADEACHDSASVDRLMGKYDVVNIKLDKAGGLTEAIRLRETARAAGLGVMVGCMLGSSLAMAPAVLLAQEAEVVDLDGPLLLAQDHDPGLRFDGSRIEPPDPLLWG